MAARSKETRQALSRPAFLKNSDEGSVRLDDCDGLGRMLFLEPVRRVVGRGLKVAGSPERAVEVDDVAGTRNFLHGQDVADSSPKPYVRGRAVALAVADGNSRSTGATPLPRERRVIRRPPPRRRRRRRPAAPAAAGSAAASAAVAGADVRVAAWFHPPGRYQQSFGRRSQARRKSFGYLTTIEWEIPVPPAYPLGEPGGSPRGSSGSPYLGSTNHSHVDGCSSGARENL